MTGQSQLNELIGVRFPNGEERWLKVDHIPLTEGPQGWSTLGIGADVTSFRVGQQAAETRTRMLEVLLRLAEELRDVARTHEAVAGAVARALADALPECGLSISSRNGGWVELQAAIQRPDGHPLPNRVPITAGTTKRSSSGTHVNLDVWATDAYGPTVLGGMERPFRSIVTVPLPGPDGEPRGALIATSGAPGAFGALDIVLLERASRLIPNFD